MSKPTYEELEQQLERVTRERDLFRTALQTVKERHFKYIKKPDFKETWKDGKPIPGESIMQPAREAFALLDPEYFEKKIKESK